jgi:DNA modification methylase
MLRSLIGDCRAILPTLAAGSIDCVVTSPPYFGLRDYGVAGQIGLEATPEAFVAEMVAVFREVCRVLKDEGTVWLNLGDSYAGGSGGDRTIAGDGRVNGGKARSRNPVSSLKPKDLLGIPWRVAFALQADGWYLRSDIIWAKPNPMPESVTDRPTSAYEHVFLLAKQPRYFYDAEAVKEDITGGAHPRRKDSERCPPKGADPNDNRPGTWRDTYLPNSRNLRNVWTIASAPFAEAHFATFPPALAERCIKAGCPAGGVVLDPFAGAGTVGLVADRLGRDAVLIELNPTYVAMSRERIVSDAPLFVQMT